LPSVLKKPGSSLRKPTVVATEAGEMGAEAMEETEAVAMEVPATVAVMREETAEMVMETETIPGLLGIKVTRAIVTMQSRMTLLL
jgi:hypothetical protein